MSIKGTDEKLNPRKLRLGMVGGGQGAFIGAVHRAAARLDGRYELVAGALSSEPQVALQSALELGIEPSRAYVDFTRMALAEQQRQDGIDVVSIVTPNYLHFLVAKAFLEAGIHVICDKPMTLTLVESEELAEIVKRVGLVFVLTQNNTGYPMVRQAREMVAEGLLGKVQVVRVSYAQDWLTTGVEHEGHKQAVWRMNPDYAGIGGAVADIGVHAFNLAQYITGLELESVCADLHSFGAGRLLDDNANILLRYKNGAKGILWASQVAPGNNNALTIGIYGEKGGLEWNGENNDYLRFTPIGEPPRIITRGGSGAYEVAMNSTRIPAGHPEGYIEGFANLYSDTADLILRHENDSKVQADHLPGIASGLSGMRFIAACVESSDKGSIWTPVQGDNK